jgi:hypothetical protein
MPEEMASFTGDYWSEELETEFGICKDEREDSAAYLASRSLRPESYHAELCRGSETNSEKPAKTTSERKLLHERVERLAPNQVTAVR